MFNTEEALYEELAEYVMFASDRTMDGLNEKLNSLELEFRKNKGLEDVNKAVKKALDPKMGHYKTELEVSALAMYLKVDVVKRKKRYKKGDRVRIVSEFPKQGGLPIKYNGPKREEWQGKVMTIDEVKDRGYLMVEDKHMWGWTSDLIVGKE